MFPERVDERPGLGSVRTASEDLNFARVERDGDTAAIGTPGVTRDRVRAETERFRHGDGREGNARVVIIRLRSARGRRCMTTNTCLASLNSM